MWISEVLVVVDPRNPDRNRVCDIADALADAGAAVSEIDDAHCVVTATLPAAAVALVRAMEGVSYVRPFLTYYCSAAA
jgi:hypothetical protein